MPAVGIVPVWQIRQAERGDPDHGGAGGGSPGGGNRRERLAGDPGHAGPQGNGRAARPVPREFPESPSSRRYLLDRSQRRSAPRSARLAAATFETSEIGASVL